MFWAVDREIDGSVTSARHDRPTILWVEASAGGAARRRGLREASSAPLREAPESGLRCVLAWVGDSTAVAADMRDGGVPLAATRDHNADSTEERRA